MTVDRTNEESTHDDVQGAPLGGDEGTAANLEADNPVEEETLQALDPDQAPA